MIFEDMPNGKTAIIICSGNDNNDVNITSQKIQVLIEHIFAAIEQMVENSVDHLSDILKQRNEHEGCDLTHSTLDLSRKRIFYFNNCQLTKDCRSDWQYEIPIRVRTVLQADKILRTEYTD